MRWISYCSPFYCNWSYFFSHIWTTPASVSTMFNPLCFDICCRKFGVCMTVITVSSQIPIQWVSAKIAFKGDYNGDKCGQAIKAIFADASFANVDRPSLRGDFAVSSLHSLYTQVLFRRPLRPTLLQKRDRLVKPAFFEPFCAYQLDVVVMHPLSAHSTLQCFWVGEANGREWFHATTSLLSYGFNCRVNIAFGRFLMWIKDILHQSSLAKYYGRCHD